MSITLRGVEHIRYTGFGKPIRADGFKRWEMAAPANQMPP